MADENHKLQSDPPEGSRKTVEHELCRQGKDGGVTEKTTVTKTTENKTTSSKTKG